MHNLLYADPRVDDRIRPDEYLLYIHFGCELQASREGEGGYSSNPPLDGEHTYNPV